MSSDAPQSPLAIGPALRYAEALFDLSRERDALDVTERDFEALGAAIAASAELRAFLKSPVYDADEKARVMGAIAERAGISPLTRNFLGVAARNRRLFALEGIMRAFALRLADHRGEVSATALSASPLTDDQARRLRGEIEGLVGKAVKLSVKVDPDLLGGLMVRVGSKMFDSSLKTKLNRLKSVMKEA
jgi:F-type H+-transporting ATPase subunit delta